MNLLHIAPPSVFSPHSRINRYAAVPFEEGRRMAARIPSDRFVALEGHNHLILEDEPAWPRFLQEVRAFLV